jgi:3-oxoacyl-[acyl-carrier protein] reductase
MNMQKRKALITGSGRNLGRGIALRLAQAGHDVAIHARGNIGDAQEVADAARAMGVQAVTCVGDIGSSDDVRAMARDVLGAFGNIDILVNVAAARPFQSFMDMSTDDWEQVMRTNVTGVFQLTQALLPGMIERRWGRVINFAGMNSIRGYPQRVHIAASKHAVWGMTKALSREVGAHNITVNCVSPGPAESEHADAAFDALIAAQVKEIPLGRLGRQSEIAGMVAFLASDEGGFVSGQMMQVNGGAET